MTKYLLTITTILQTNTTDTRREEFEVGLFELDGPWLVLYTVADKDGNRHPFKLIKASEIIVDVKKVS